MSSETIEETLDQEIAELQSQVESTTKALRLHATALLTSPHVATALADAALASSTSSNSSHSSSNSRHAPTSSLLAEKLRASAARQRAHSQRCLYRLAGGGVTAFRVRDPDPNAVDEGRVFGLRFEAMSRTRFFRTYFVLLNRPYGSDGQQDRDDGPRRTMGRAAFLKVHRHTIPEGIPVGGLAARYLPPPTLTDEEYRELERESGPRRRHREQDLVAFVRAVRHELVAYHNRLGVVADTKRAAAAAAAVTAYQQDDGVSSDILVDIRTADAEAKQVHVEWADGRTGRVSIDDKGRIGQTVIFGPRGREWSASFDPVLRGGRLKAAEAREVEGLLARLGLAAAE